MENKKTKTPIIEEGIKKWHRPTAMVCYNISSSPIDLSGKQLYKDYIVVKDISKKYIDKVIIYGKRLYKTIKDTLK